MGRCGVFVFVHAEGRGGQVEVTWALWGYGDSVKMFPLDEHVQDSYTDSEREMKNERFNDLEPCQLNMAKKS